MWRAWCKSHKGPNMTVDEAKTHPPGTQSDAKMYQNDTQKTPKCRRARPKCPPTAQKEFTVCHRWSGGSPGGPPSAPRAAAQVRGAILGAILGAQKCPKSDQKGSRNHRKFGSSFLAVFGAHFGYNFGEFLVQNGAPERIRGAGFKFGPFLKIYRKTYVKSTFFTWVGRTC